MQASRFLNNVKTVATIAALAIGSVGPFAIAGRGMATLPMTLARSQSLEGLTGGNFRPPGPIGAPRRTEGGATRSGGDDCATLMLPKFSVKDAAGAPVEYGYTRVQLGLPVFYVQVPERQVTMRFQLRDRETSEVLYQMQVQTNGQAGIYAIKVPEEFQGKAIQIAPEQVLQGTLQSACLDPITSDWSIAMEEGLLYPVETDPAVAGALNEAASELDRVRIYAREGLWNDLMASFLAWQRSQPDDATVRQQWEAIVTQLAQDFPVTNGETPNTTHQFFMDAATVPLTPATVDDTVYN